jgi:predicted nucleic acid-binding protein
MKIVLDTNAYTALMKGEERITSVLETGSKLATRDRHFEHVPGIYIVPF